MQLYTETGLLVTDIDTLTDNQILVFRLSPTLFAESANQWNPDKLAQLQVKFKDVDTVSELLSCTPISSSSPSPSLCLTSTSVTSPSSSSVEMKFELSDRARSLLMVTNCLSRENIQRYDELAASYRKDPKLSFSDPPPSSSPSPSLPPSSSPSCEQLQHPIWKSLYMLLKYSNHESGVDAFVSLLLSELGFMQEWLWLFPQLSLPLMFGKIAKTAIADFTILDVFSFYRMAVVEDKSENEIRQNSEPQIIAEAIAVHQQNKIKRAAVAIKRARITTAAAIGETLPIGTGGIGVPAVGNEDSNKKYKSDRLAVGQGDDGVAGGVHVGLSAGASDATSIVDSSLSVPGGAFDLENVDDQQTLIAVRVNGTQFYFYAVPSTPQLLHAMSVGLAGQTHQYLPTLAHSQLFACHFDMNVSLLILGRVPWCFLVFRPCERLLKHG